jgi:hypothetical protein
MAALVKLRCGLPKSLRPLCESGCAYREPTLNHLRCRIVNKSSPCAAPCTDNCICKPGPDTTLTIKEVTRKERNEMFLQ